MGQHGGNQSHRTETRGNGPHGGGGSMSDAD